MPELTADFQPLPEEYQHIIRLTQDTYKIAVAPLQLLVGAIAIFYRIAGQSLLNINIEAFPF